MKLYLSGPMTHYPNLNRPAFYKAARKLRRAGYKVINPPELDAKEPYKSWEGNLKRDLRYLTMNDAIATLSGWKKSKGANLEIYVARQLSMPVHPVTYYLKHKRRLICKNN